MDTLYLLLVDTLLKSRSVEIHCFLIFPAQPHFTGCHAIIWSIHLPGPLLSRWWVHLDPGAFFGIEPHLHLPLFLGQQAFLCPTLLSGLWTHLSFTVFSI